MKDASDRISEWAQNIKESVPPEWDRLPEIYLYMDQVLTYMNKQLHLFERDENTCFLTSSMINNYVKDGALPRPNQKKYSREHLAVLAIICMLKQVLSIQDIKALVNILLQTTSQSEMYSRFSEAQNIAMKDVSKRVTDTAKQGKTSLTLLAIELSVEANARRTAAERILSELSKDGVAGKNKTVKK